MSGEAAALTFLLQTLVEEFRGYTVLRDEANSEFRQLEDELLKLQAFLKDSEKMDQKTEFVIVQERKIRELVYDIQDTIEIFLTKTTAAKTKNFFSRSIENFSTKMAKQVKTLRQTRVEPVIKSIEAQLGKIKVDERSGSEQPRMEVLNMDHPNMIEEIVDFEDEEMIIGYLMESKDKLDVVSIIGMAGIGKSTLAWKIFQNEGIAEEFELRIWVDASQKLNKVLLKILKSFAPEGVSNPDQEDLAAAVCGCLKEKKFLLVLDNVCSSQDWQEIKKILPIANTKAKVLVTSRDKEVGAVYAINYREPHNLDFLKADKSWELLQLTLFGNGKSCPKELHQVGQEIAIKCGGVPLIIVVIGGILRSRYNRTLSNVVRAREWNEVSKNMNEISLDEGYEKTISKVVGYSYDRLPYELRGCFLSFGMFPENEEISASTLTQLWMAEGFIRPRPRGVESFEETAERMLNYFIKMNLLMVEKKHLDQIRTCRVHDMIRRFCISQAEKENVFRVMEESRRLISHPVSEPTKFYRLCLHSNLNTFLSGKPKVPHVRTFMCFCKQVNHMEDMHIKGIHKAFRLLRVLSCKSISFGRFPNLTKLMLLKSITLSVDNLDVLPKQISKLLNLQTLVVETKSHSITVNANIWKMIQLRHVKTKAAMFLVDKKRKVQDGGNLQTLTRLSPESCTMYEEKLRNLNTLGVRGKLAINVLNNMSLEKFQNLEKLKLENEDLVNKGALNPISLPHPHHFPSNLKKVTLSYTYLSWKQHMPKLAKIESLEVLKLKDNAFTGIHWPAVDDGFKHLQFLLIANTDLFAWEVSHAQFPELRWLVLRKCQKLQNIPGEELAEKLEKLEIEHVNETTVESAKKIEQGKRSSAAPFQLIIGPGCN